MNPNKTPRFLKLDENRPLIHEGESFAKVCLKSDWFGFYDWLRDQNRSLIGIRLALDPEFNQIAMFANLSGVYASKDSKELHIFFPTTAQ